MPGFSFIKSKKKMKINLAKDFTFFSNGQMVMQFPISINLTELLKGSSTCRSPLSAVLLSRNFETKEKS